MYTAKFPIIIIELEDVIKEVCKLKARGSEMSIYLKLTCLIGEILLHIIFICDNYMKCT